MTTRPLRPLRDLRSSFACLTLGMAALALSGSIGCSSAGSGESDFGNTAGSSQGGSSNAGSAGSAGSTAGGSAGASGTAGIAGSAGSVNAGGSGGTGTACDSAKFDSSMQPGAVLIVFDASMSMDDGPDGSSSSGPTKWEISTNAIRAMVDDLPDATLVGVMLFPDDVSNNDCAVDTIPNVEVAPLSQNRDAIKATLNPNTPPYGGATPLGHAIEKGHTYLHNRSDLAGVKAVLLVTDGVPSTTCNETEQDTPQNAKLGLQNWNQKTFVVGLAGSNEQLLSLAAFNGGTPRSPDCIPQCCPNSGGIFSSGCTEQELATCCNYSAEGAGTEAALVSALGEFASAFLTSCVFTVPKGDNPGDFDPNLVNVVVSINGANGETIPQNATTGWTYTDDTYDTLELHGDICTQILNQPSSVEIELGCPTQIQ